MAFYTLFTLTAYYNLKIDQIDIKTVFLNSQIIKDIYIKHLYSFSKSKKVYYLLKGLYGLKQSPYI